ncbi:hypothetical protein [Pseudooceanicola sp.]|nr:hypothetical protein [Pseudooceanicola sp.]MDF1854671.1 hypothetical protein [Pseudooceanicola sp.]
MLEVLPGVLAASSILLIAVLSPGPAVAMLLAAFAFKRASARG